MIDVKKTRPTGTLPSPRSFKNLRKAVRRLENVPPVVLREAQKQGFPDMRSLILPPPLILESLQKPILRDLLVTRIGYCSRAAGHYIPRPEGSLDHILHYCAAGSGWLKMEGQQWKIDAETAMFIPRGVPHLYGADPGKPWSIYWIHFTGRQAGDFFEALRVSAKQPLLRLPCTEEILSALRQVEAPMSGVPSRTNLIAASTALSWFLGLVQLRCSALEQEERTAGENIQQTIDFMGSNLSRRVSLRELAHLARMSVSRYETTFTRQIGCSPISYFLRMKIQKASRLLTETNLPIKAIGLEIGYEDPYYFSRLFKKLAGISPARFRHPVAPQ